MKVSQLLRWALAAACAVQLAPSVVAGPVGGWVVTESGRLVASDQTAGDFFGSSVAVDGNTLVVGAERDDLEVGVGNDAGSAYVFERGVDGTWVEVAKLRGSDTAGRDDFGNSVAISGDTIIVGAWLHDLGGALDAGAAYVFERDYGGAGAWGEVTKITAPGAAAGDYFGGSVDLDRNTLVVGSSLDDHSGWAGAGSAYICERDYGGSNVWGEVTKLIAADPGFQDAFGSSVSISSDLILIGATADDLPGAIDAGSAYLFSRDVGGSGAWGQVRKLTAWDAAAGDAFGTSVVVDGGTAAVGAVFDDIAGASSAGSAYVFERDNGGRNAWGQTFLKSATPLPSAHFGASLSLVEGRLLVGEPHGQSPVASDPGVAHVFERDRHGAGGWTEIAEVYALDGLDRDDFAVSVSLAGNLVVVGVRLDDSGYDIEGAEGLAVDPLTGTLYGVDIDADQLVTVNTTTGVATPVGPLTDAVGTYFSNVQGLAFDPGAGTLYASDVNGAQLIAIDPLTATCSAVGPLGFANVRGLAFDASTGTLYGCDDNTDQLIFINPATGAGTAIGPLGFGRVWSLAFDSAAGALYGTHGGPASTKKLITIDATTGAGSLVGITGNDELRGLAWAPATGTLFGSNRDAEELVTLDPGTGATSSVGGFYSLVSWTGSSYLFELSFGSEAYCTAGTSASGCKASIADSGSPSATAGSGYHLIATNVEGDKDGLFFFGTNGRQANPWGNGSSYQCVVPPVTRAGLLNGSGTSGACDGSFAQDLNALWTAKPNKNPGAGSFVDAQLWYRDPQSTSNQTTGLSNAIELQVGP